MIALITLASSPFIMNPNDFKHEIESTVKELTGRTFIIDGDIELSLFPWIGFSTQKITLGNAKGFKAPYFAQIKQSQLKIRVIPFLSKKLEVSEIVIKGLVLHLAKNKHGKTNWADLEALSTEDDSATENPLSAFAIAGFSLENAIITWDDLPSNQHASLNNINLSIGQWGFEKTIPLKLSLDLANNTPELKQSVNFSTDFSVNEALDYFQLQNTQLKLKTQSPLIATDSLTVQLLGNFKFDQQKQVLSFNDIEINSGRLVFKAKGYYNLQHQNLTLSTVIKQLDLMEWSAVIGFNLPKNVNKKMLILNLATDLSFNTAQQQLRVRKFRVDNGKLNLSAKGQYNLESQNLTLSTVIKQLDLMKWSALMGFSIPKNIHKKVLTLNLATDLTFNNAQQQLQVSKFRIDNGKLNLSAKGQYDLEQQNLTLASLKIAPFNPRNVLPLFGIVLPKMANKNVLSTIALSLKLEANKNKAIINNLRLNVDKTLLKGKVNIHSFSDPTVKFDLLVNKINIDRYLPIEKKTSKTDKASNTQTKALDPIKILQTLKASGKIVIEQLKTNGVTVKGITLELDEKKAL